MSSWKLIQKAKELLEAEKGTVTKDFGGKVSVALVYPNTYHVGMSSLGFQTIYDLFNSFDDVVCERSFLPGKDDLKEFIRTNTALFSLESQRPLNEFHIIAFSISYENDYLNVLKLLELSNIPLKSDDRNSSYPLVIAGGIAMMSNPEPLSPYIDIFFLGEAEALIPKFIDSYRKAKREDKMGLLNDLSGIEGAYIPSLWDVSYNSDGTVEDIKSQVKGSDEVKVVKLDDMDQSPCYSRILTPNTEFSDMFLVEISRGCRQWCKFCLIGNFMGNVRFRDMDKIISNIDSGLAMTKKIGLLGSSVTEHPDFDKLCLSLMNRDLEASISSIRFDSLKRPLVDLLAKGGQRTVTLAPESGSDTLRKLVGKPMKEDEIIDGVKAAIAKGILNLKLYFLIGLPGETRDDVKEIANLIKKIRHCVIAESRGKARLGRITVSINPFVPKPFTPFQWIEMEQVSSLKEKLKFIRDSIKGLSNVVLTFDLPKWSYVQALLARGDRRVGELLLKAHKFGGNWYKAFKALNINPDFYVYRRRGEKEIFPWDFIDNGITKERLVKSLNKGFEDQVVE